MWSGWKSWLHCRNFILRTSTRSYVDLCCSMIISHITEFTVSTTVQYSNCWVLIYWILSSTMNSRKNVCLCGWLKKLQSMCYWVWSTFMSTAILFTQILNQKISWSRWSHSKKWNSLKISKNIKLNLLAWSTWKICKPVKILRQRRKTKKRNWRKSRKNRVRKYNKEITTSKTMTQVNKVVSHLLTIQINKWNHKQKI